MIAAAAGVLLTLAGYWLNANLLLWAQVNQGTNLYLHNAASWALQQNLNSRIHYLAPVSLNVCESQQPLVHTPLQTLNEKMAWERQQEFSSQVGKGDSGSICHLSLVDSTGGPAERVY